MGMVKINSNITLEKPKQKLLIQIDSALLFYKYLSLELVVINPLSTKSFNLINKTSRWFCYLWHWTILYFQQNHAITNLRNITQNLIKFKFLHFCKFLTYIWSYQNLQHVNTNSNNFFNSTKESLSHPANFYKYVQAEYWDCTSINVTCILMKDT